MYQTMPTPFHLSCCHGCIAPPESKPESWEYVANFLGLGFRVQRTLQDVRGLTPGRMREDVDETAHVSTH